MPEFTWQEGALAIAVHSLPPGTHAQTIGLETPSQAVQRYPAEDLLYTGRLIKGGGRIGRYWRVGTGLAWMVDLACMTLPAWLTQPTGFTCLH